MNITHVGPSPGAWLPYQGQHHWLEVGFLNFFLLLAGMWSDLCDTSLIQAVTITVHLYLQLLWYIQETLLHCNHPLFPTLNNLPTPLFQWSLSLWKRCAVINVHFRAECYAIFYYLHIGLLWVSVFTAIYFKKKKPLTNYYDEKKKHLEWLSFDNIGRLCQSPELECLSSRSKFSTGYTIPPLPPFETENDLSFTLHFPIRYDIFPRWLTLRKHMNKLIW